jgi:serine/threonine-protein kinase
MHGYAVPAETAQDAADAFGLLKSPLPVYAPKTLALASVGRAHFLAGRIDEALPLLERGATSCMALEFPVAHTRANLWLGHAREAKGDKDGACKAYQVVLSRWGRAKPRSVSAEDARLRIKALGCK